MQTTRQGKKKNIENTASQLFKSIYKNNHWGDSLSRSGTGSNLEQTKITRKAIIDVVKKYQIKTLLDIPCGDFFWLKEIKSEIETYLDSYIGSDIVDEMIQKNITLYSNEKIRFSVMDIKGSVLPYSDLLLCRDCLVHFSFDDILEALQNIKKSKCGLLLTTTFPNQKNRDIITGAWRPIDLQKYPFYLHTPILVLNEECTESNNQYGNKSLGLWQVKKIGLIKMKIALSVLNIYRKIRSLLKNKN